VVHGPHAYVSPSWYPDKEAEARVPTWNYAVAHLAGTLGDLRRRGLAGRAASTTSATSTRARVGRDWRFEYGRDDHRSQLRGIIGFRFPRRYRFAEVQAQPEPPGRNRLAVAGQLESQSTRRQPRHRRADARPAPHRKPEAMDLDLNGKHALVCGASQGIGLATAKALAELGADVTLLAVAPTCWSRSRARCRVRAHRRPRLDRR
jgi:hypothetical protein